MSIVTLIKPFKNTFSEDVWRYGKLFKIQVQAQKIIPHITNNYKMCSFQTLSQSISTFVLVPKGKILLLVKASTWVESLKTNLEMVKKKRWKMSDVNGCIFLTTSEGSSSS